MNCQRECHQAGYQYGPISMDDNFTLQEGCTRDFELYDQTSSQIHTHQQVWPRHHQLQTQPLDHLQAGQHDGEQSDWLATGEPLTYSHGTFIDPSSSLQDKLNESLITPSTPPERIIQRVKANKKERRRTQSINQAFSELRRHIPDVPSDTKLSKIKTLRLAISYINHLSHMLTGDQNHHRFDQINNLEVCNRLKNKPIGEQTTSNHKTLKPCATAKTDQGTNRDRKHRTGWPEIIWQTSRSIGQVNTTDRVK